MKNHISNKQLREFGFLIGFAFPFIIGLILPAIRGHSFMFWTLWISFPSIFIASLKPSLLFYPYKIWMRLGYVLGWVNSRIILGAVYIIILLPISFIMKILGYDPLKIKQIERKTYRENKPNHKINLKKIF